MKIFERRVVLLLQIDHQYLSEWRITNIARGKDLGWLRLVAFCCDAKDMPWAKSNFYVVAVTFFICQPTVRYHQYRNAGYCTRFHLFDTNSYEAAAAL